jgi:hypothetical protein
MHCLKCCIQTLSNIFIGWIRKFIYETNQCGISCEPFLENIFNRYVSG